MKNRQDTTVVVGMSGGVDSSVAAALLLKQGYRVLGITMKTYDFDEVGGRSPSETSCCGLGAVHDARMVAGSLGIPHYTVDFRKEFGEAVIGTFVDEYLKGRTPNPCIACNREIKWGALLRKADALGADFIATGHYARLRYSDDTRRWVISRAVYDKKDQSYALWSVPQEALARTMFPLGGMTKPEVRELATSFGLRTAMKDESYDICFVEDNDYTRFLREREPALQERVAGGKLLKGDTVVGEHAGFPFYTIGQRKGIGAHGSKMYVTGIDASTNTVKIGPDADLWNRVLTASGVQWSGREIPRGPIEAQAKVRYGDEATPCTVEPTSSDAIRVVFRTPKRAITPGQSVVLYDGEDLIGGGIIDSFENEPGSKPLSA